MSAFSPAIREFLATPDDARRLGPYRCKDLLDKAGSAPVFRAVEEHAGLDLREVAVKVFDIGKTAGAAATGGTPVASRSPSRSGSAFPRRSLPRTRRASFTATSSRRTSCSRTARTS